MELLLISEKKMKIMLSKEDMDAYGLDAEKLDYSISATRDSLDRIFEIAKIKTGFQMGNGKRFVQAYPSQSGGCEIFITLLEGSAPNLLSEGRDKIICSCFNDVVDLNLAAQYIAYNTNVKDVVAYRDMYTGYYYLLAELEKEISAGIEEYLLAYLYEIGSLGAVLTSKDDFSKERYERYDVKKSAKKRNNK